MRLLCAGLLTLSFGLFVACADDKKETPKEAPKGDRADRLKEMKKKFDEDFDQLVKKFQKAATPEEKTAIRTEAIKLSATTANTVAGLAAEDPKDAVAFEAAEFVLSRLAIFGGEGPGFDKASAIIAEHHMGNPRVKSLVIMASQMGAGGKKLLTAAAEKATDKDIKGMALYFLGSTLAEEAEDQDDPKKADALTAQAIKYLEEAAAVAPGATIGRETIGEKVKTDLVGLKSLGIGKPVPDIEGTGLDGKKVKLSSFKGKVVLLDIWATWCPPCRAMIPHEREMVKKLKDRPFVLLSVSADDEKDALTGFLEKNEMPWTHWWDGGDRKIVTTFRVKAFPTLYLIDEKGIIRKKWVGSPGNEALDKAVEELVKAAEKK